MKRLLVVAGAAVLAFAPVKVMAASDGAERENVVTTTAEVRAIDYATRAVLLRGESGNLFEVTVGPDVPNLSQVNVGDILDITYYEAVVVHIADEGSADLPSAAVFTARAAEGEVPGMATAAMLNTVVELVHYDPDSHIATFINPDGTPGSVFVSPQIQEFAAGLEKGDRVDITVARALAISMEEDAAGEP